MIGRKQIIEQLVELSNWLGAPEQDCAILGEGNTSARISEKSFIVKASGTELGTIDASGFIEIDLQQAISLVMSRNVTDTQVREALMKARIDPVEDRMPSVETSLHAVCLAMEGIDFVGHSHPTAINAFTCSNGFQKALQNRLFPDEVVVCGAEPLLIPYVDPGVKLAQAVSAGLREYCDKMGTPPKEIYMQNHGFIALGSSPKQVQSITAMAVKAARIRLGTQSFGGPNPMSAADVRRIDSRPDEHYRQAVIKNQ